MPQTVQILRTISDVSPTSLLPGEFSAVLSGNTKLFLGDNTGVRMLMSTDPADAGTAVGGRLFLPLAGGTLTGPLNVANPSANTTAMNSLRLTGVGTGATGGAARVLLQTASNSVGKLALSMFNTTQNAGAGIYGNAGAGSLDLHFSGMDITGTPVGGAWMRMFNNAGALSVLLDVNTVVGAAAWLTLDNEPTGPQHATTKLYVDAGDAANTVALANYLPLIGGTLSGPLTLPVAAPTADAMATNKAYVDLRDSELQEQIDLLAENLVFSGQIDIVIDNVTWTLAALGSVPGLQNGPLPVPSMPLRGFYLIANNSGQPPLGNVPPGTYTRGDWLICDGTQWVELTLDLTNVTAPVVALSPAIPNLGPNVQTALTYLEANYLPRSGGPAFAMTGGLSLGSALAPGGPTDLSRHIALWGTVYGFNVTSNRLNYVCSPAAAHVFVHGASDVATFGTQATVNVPLVAQSTVTLSADPLLDLEAATKQYVDAAVAGSITQVVVDGVSIVGDGLVGGTPLSVELIDGGTY